MTVPRFQPRYHDWSGAPVPPAVNGKFIATIDGELYRGQPDGKWLHFGSFIPVPDMTAFNNLPIKGKGKIYAINNALYRWDGTTLISLSASLTGIPDNTETGGIYSLLKTSATTGNWITRGATTAPDPVNDGTYTLTKTGTDYSWSQFTESPDLANAIALQVTLLNGVP